MGPDELDDEDFEIPADADAEDWDEETLGFDDDPEIDLGRDYLS